MFSSTKSRRRRQYRLALGTKEYFVDLLFYHRFLKALVAIDLKVGSFEPEFSGKMDFYLNLLNRAVLRNPERFPDDFAFKLTLAETRALMFQPGTSKPGRSGTRKPVTLTEQGVATAGNRRDFLTPVL